jgi:hypothetical protein
MQKFFSAFPSGSPGLGLLLLRALIVLRFFTADLNLPGWLLVVFAPVGICLLLGVLTPIAAVIIGLGALTSAIVFSNSVAVVMTILAVAIALLGPGAFSVDARLFGRRELLIHTDRSAYKDSSNVSSR